MTFSDTVAQAAIDDSPRPCADAVVAPSLDLNAE